MNELRMTTVGTLISGAQEEELERETKVWSKQDDEGKDKKVR